MEEEMVGGEAGKVIFTVVAGGGNGGWGGRRGHIYCCGWGRKWWVGRSERSYLLLWLGEEMAGGEVGKVIFTILAGGGNGGWGGRKGHIYYCGRG